MWLLVHQNYAGVPDGYNRYKTAFCTICCVQMERILAEATLFVLVIYVVNAAIRFLAMCVEKKSIRPDVYKSHSALNESKEQASNIFLLCQCTL